MYKSKRFCYPSPFLAGPCAPDTALPESGQQALCRDAGAHPRGGLAAYIRHHRGLAEQVHRVPDYGGESVAQEGVAWSLCPPASDRVRAHVYTWFSA